MNKNYWKGRNWQEMKASAVEISLLKRPGKRMRDEKMRMRKAWLAAWRERYWGQESLGKIKVVTPVRGWNKRCFTLRRDAVTGGACVCALNPLATCAQWGLCWAECGRDWWTNCLCLNVSLRSSNPRYCVPWAVHNLLASSYVLINLFVLCKWRCNQRWEPQVHLILLNF